MRHPDPIVRRCQRVLAMVHELHKRGYQRLRIMPGMSPSGMYLAMQRDAAIEHTREPWSDGARPFSGFRQLLVIDGNTVFRLDRCEHCDRSRPCRKIPGPVSRDRGCRARAGLGYAGCMPRCLVTSESVTCPWRMLTGRMIQIRDGFPRPTGSIPGCLCRLGAKPENRVDPFLLSRSRCHQRASELDASHARSNCSRLQVDLPVANR